MELAFSKYTGCGNDFILIDNRSCCFPAANTQFIQRLCERKRGIGADGLILLETSAVADFRMRIYNADGFEAEMCGNGARCIVEFAREMGMSQTHFTIQTMHRILQASYGGTEIAIEMGVPQEIKWAIPLAVGELSLMLHHINTGVPHVVLFVDEIEDPKWMKLAPHIRSHPYFAPRGVNVNFATLAQNTIRVRTYERGVEGETLACGTGAAAAAIAAATLYGVPSPILVQTRSGEALKITCPLSPETQPVYMEGPVAYIFKGTFSSSLFV